MISDSKMQPLLHDPALAAIYSTDPAVAELEQAFLTRLLAAASDQSATTGSLRETDVNDQFGRDLQRIQHPIFEALASALSRSVSTEASFGPFRRSKSHAPDT